MKGHSITKFHFKYFVFTLHNGFYIVYTWLPAKDETSRTIKYGFIDKKKEISNMYVTRQAEKNDIIRIYNR